MRAAVLASKRAIDAQQTSRREELLRSSVVQEKQSLNEKVTCVSTRTSPYMLFNQFHLVRTH